MPELQMTLAEAERLGRVKRHIYDEGWDEDYAIVRLDELAHIATRTNPDKLAKLRAEWNPKWFEAITLQEGIDGHGRERFILRDGNHRLTLARERGSRTIEAIIQGSPRPAAPGE